MNKKDIIKSFDKLLPSETQKVKMLDNIINYKNKKRKYIMATVGLATTACICLFLIKPTSDIPKQISPTNYRMNENIIYNGQSYCETGIWNKDVDDLKKVDDSNKTIGGTVYTSTDRDIIVIYVDGVYKEFRICEGEGK